MTYLYGMSRTPEGDEKKVIKSYQIKPKVYKDFQEVCHDLNINSLSAQIEKLIEEFVKKHKKK